LKAREFGRRVLPFVLGPDREPEKKSLATDMDSSFLR
jgi:hypothetical protein